MDDAAIGPVAIADEVVRSLILGKMLPRSGVQPFGDRICCDVGPDEVFAVEQDDDEGIAQVETDSWNNEQVQAALPSAWLRKKVRHSWRNRAA
jgi:hypothetical protein